MINETQNETRTTRGKQAAGAKDRKTRRTKRPNFLTSRPTPSRLFSLIRRPQLFPPPPGVGRAALVGPPRSPSHPLPRRVSITHAIASSALARRISSSPGVISPHAPFSVAHPSMPPSPRPRRTPGRNDLRRPSSWHPSNAPLTRQAERGEERDEVNGVRFPIVVSIVILIVVALVARRRLIAYRPQGFHPGEAVILGVIYSAPFSSAHFVRPRFIVSSIPRLTIPSGRADKQAAGGRQGGRQDGRADGERLSLSAPSSYSRPSYRPRSRLVPRVARTGRRASRSS